MKRIIGIIVSILLTMTVAFNTGCNVGGANISLEGLSLGTVTMDGKPVAGLPSNKINLSLEVSARKVLVNTTAEGTILTLVPSEATIEIKANGVSIKGVKPEQIKVEWVTTKQD